VDSIFYSNGFHNSIAVSPKGDKMYFSSGQIFQKISEFDIDRCSGDIFYNRDYLISNFSIDTLTNYWNGVELVQGMYCLTLSPNGRYLYYFDTDYTMKGVMEVFMTPDGEIDSMLSYKIDMYNTNGNRTLWQLDTWGDNAPPTVSKIMQDDFYADNSGKTEKIFASINMAPDYKIYASVATFFAGYIGSDEGWGIVNRPDQPGMACHFTWEPRLSGNLNWRPVNFDLGPLDGSPCDTLGLDGVPKAIFSYGYTTDHEVYFDNYSVLNPETWSWTFGDGGQSSDFNTAHYYPNNGNYEVCLTVSNSLGSDTYCKNVPIGTTSSQDLPNAGIELFPNPADSYLTIQCPQGLPLELKFEVFDTEGSRLLEVGFSSTTSRYVDVAMLPSGTYHYSVSSSGNKLIQSGTFSKK
jgi:PKD repeat protein